MTLGPVLLAVTLAFSNGLRTNADPREEAAGAFAAGEAAFAAGDYDDAVAQFELANKLVEHPNTLYNLGLAQEQAGDLPGAWQSFRRLEQSHASAAERDDARTRLGRIERKVAVLKVIARPRQRICLDSKPMERRDADHYEVAAREGDYLLVVDKSTVPIRLSTGQTRVVELSRGSELAGGRRTSAAVPVLVGIAVGSAAAAAGLGGAALGVNPQNSEAKLGLGAASISAAAIATGAGLAALIVHRRAQNRERRRTPDAPCPPHPDVAKP
jgi:tetratricopeptide (TPR) repeat protein